MPTMLRIDDACYSVLLIVHVRLREIWQCAGMRTQIYRRHEGALSKSQSEVRETDPRRRFSLTYWRKRFPL